MCDFHSHGDIGFLRTSAVRRLPSNCDLLFVLSSSAGGIGGDNHTNWSDAGPQETVRCLPAAGESSCAHVPPLQAASPRLPECVAWSRGSVMILPRSSAVHAKCSRFPRVTRTIFFATFAGLISEDSIPQPYVSLKTDMVFRLNPCASSRYLLNRSDHWTTSNLRFASIDFAAIASSVDASTFRSAKWSP